MSRWLKVAIAGLVVSVALGAGAAAAVLAVTSGNGSEQLSAAPGDVLAEEKEGRPWLGIIAGRYGDEGVIVHQVFADSPAHQAGVKRGDLIKAIDGKDVGNLRDLLAVLEDRDPGDVVTLAVLRDDTKLDIEVTLGERPEPLRPPEPKGPFPELGEIERGDVLGGQFRLKDDEGNVVTIKAVVGEVREIGEDHLRVALNEGGERTFRITEATVMPEKLEVGAAVAVLTLGDSDEARLVLPADEFHLPRPWQLRERLMDVLPCLKERPPGLIPERCFDLMPEMPFELMPQRRLGPMPGHEPVPLPEGEIQLFELEGIPDEMMEL